MPSGRVVVEGGRSALVDEAALVEEVEALRRELDPLVDEETQRTRALEPSLRAMYLGAVAEFERQRRSRYSSGPQRRGP